MRLSIKFNIFSLLFVLAIFSCQSNAQQAPTGKIVDLNPTAFKAAISKDNNIVILDVRTPKEVAQGVIPGA